MTERQWMLLVVTVVAISAAVVYQDRNRIQSLEAERSACSDQREKLTFEASELNQQVTQLKEKQRETDREIRRSSAKLIALEESLEKLEDERTVWEDEREKHKIREKHLKQQLDDFKSQLKASESATNEASGKLVALEKSLEKLEDERTVWEDEREKHKIREKHLKQQLDDFKSQLKASELTTNEEKIRRLKTEGEVALNKEVIKYVLLATALSDAFGKKHKATTGNANSRTHPVLIKEFKTWASLENNEEITGIAKLNEDIFVITAGSNVIESFDSATLLTKQTLTLQGYENLLDIQACNRSQSLFVINKESTGRTFISNADPYLKKTLNYWEVDGCIVSLSLTKDCHAFATCFEESKIIEYSPTGHLIQEIVLKPETGIVKPIFALKMGNGNFLVSYTGKPPLSLSCVGVAIVDSSGILLKSYSDPSKTIETVMGIAIDRLGIVLVAELVSGRVMLFSPDLEYKRDIVTKEHGTRMIQYMLLDEVNGRLFVSDASFIADEEDFEDGRILVFDME